MNTIFALSSGQPPAAVGVVRISGSGAVAAGLALAGDLPSPRRAGLRTLRDPVDASVLDRALVLVFPGPNTATGEDLVELHCHGGRAVVAAIETVLGGMAGLRRAEPGEFTRRALAAGRIDLAEAEGLGDLLAAETEQQRRAALQASEGHVSRTALRWTDAVLSLSAAIEAWLDHGDESDVAAAGDPAAMVRSGCDDLARAIGAVLGNPPVERLKDGLLVVLAGPPNAGKSTLLNALVEREAAIVSPIAGTTRDRIEAVIQRRGLVYRFVDTAGLAVESDDPIELRGIELAREAMLAADLMLWLGDDAPPVDERALWLMPRSDLPGRGMAGERIAVSAATGAGMDALWQQIERVAERAVPRLDQLVLNERQRELAGAAAVALHGAGAAADPLIVAEQLRIARTALDRITGRAGTEAMLDALFGRFCIGK